MQFHPIGHGSSFDDDITTIELFLEYSKNPKNYEVNLKLYHYYMLNAYTYKDCAEKFLEKTYQNDQNMTLVEINTLNEIFDGHIKIIEDDFKKNKVINMDEISHTLKFLGLVLCQKKSKMDVQSSDFFFFREKFKGVYILCKDNGLFGLNTYLYALFENIHIGALPTHDVFADASLLCPYIFLNHDQGHSNIIGDLKNKNLTQMKTIYYRILEDQNTDYKFKEFLICIIFIFIHEYYYSNFDSLESNDYIKFLSNMIARDKKTIDDLVKSKFLDDYKHLLDSEKIASFLNIIETNQNQFILNTYKENLDSIEFLFLLYHGLKFIVENYFDENNSLYNDMNGLLKTVKNTF